MRIITTTLLLAFFCPITLFAQTDTLAKQLTGVVVKGNVPIIKKTDEGSLINVANTMLAASTSTNELLMRTPGLMVSGSTLSVFGRGEALIYLNGRQITHERLASIPVNLVKAVEIITNPSAKYDARGRAVVNIILKNNDQEGFRNVLTQTLTKGVHVVHNTALNVNYKRQKLALSADYGMMSGTDWFNNTLSSQATYGDKVYKNFNYYESNTYTPLNSNYKLGLSYDLNSKSDFSIQYDGLYGLSKPRNSTNGQIVFPNKPALFIETFNNGNGTNRNNSINANYNLKLDTLGSTLFVGGQYNKFKTTTFDLIDEHISYKGNELGTFSERNNDGRNTIGLITAQFDVLKILKNGKKFEFGAKYAQITNDGVVDFKSRPKGAEVWNSFPALSNSFVYNEKVPAAYLQYSGNITPKITFNIGTRAEQTNLSGLSRKLNKYVVDTSYLNLFPTGKVAYQINDNWNISVNYACRINRPQYQAIDPYIWYTDSLSSFQGNPRLTSEFVNSYEGTLFFKAFSLKLGYARGHNVLRSVLITGQTGPNSFVFTWDNLKAYQQLSVSLELPFETKYWSSYHSINYTLKRFSDDRPQYRMSMPNTPLWYVYLYQQFKIPNVVNIDLTADYTSATSDAITSRQPLYQVGLGVSKSFFANKLSLRIIGNDIFKSQRFWGERAFGNIYAKYDQRFNTHYWRLTLTYKFGTLKQNTYRNRAVNEAEYGRIKK
jgi:hypothetical protein